MPFHNILSKADRAVVAYLIADGAGTADDVYPAKRSLDKAFPNTVVYSKQARVTIPHSGIWTVEMMVQVRTDPSVDVEQSAEEKQITSEDRVSLTFDALYAVTDSSASRLAELITEAARATPHEDLADFTVQAVTVMEVDAGFDPKTNAWVDTMDLELVVCAADVA